MGSFIRNACFYINRSEYNLQIKLNTIFFKFISYEFRSIGVLLTLPPEQIL